MKIGILGTRGVPNYYGGFEQFAEYLSKYLVAKGHTVSVYCSSLHPYKEKSWNGVELIFHKDKEDKIGTIAQFFYDYRCIMDAQKQDFDILLQLGYTSNSIWKSLLPKNQVIITNMDGLEWKRSKYKKPVQNFLRYAERWAATSSDYLVADSLGIKEHLKNFYSKDSTFIPYGAYCFNNAKENALEEYKLKANNYNMLIARMEPENNIETILDGVVLAEDKTPFLVIGKLTTSWAERWQEKYKNNTNIIFLGGIYDLEKLNNLRHFSKLYFHGHSVGGTNPSLLEAMASSAHIMAHDNRFNRSIIENDGFYFNDHKDVAKIITDKELGALRKEHISNNRLKVENQYNWDVVLKSYEDLFKKALS